MIPRPKNRFAKKSGQPRCAITRLVQFQKSQRQNPRLTDLHFNTIAGLEASPFQPPARKPDFGCYPAIKVVPDGFNFQSASVHHLSRRVIPAHSAETRASNVSQKPEGIFFARDRHHTTTPGMGQRFEADHWNIHLNDGKPIGEKGAWTECNP